MDLVVPRTASWLVVKSQSGDSGFLLEVIDGITRRATMRDPIAKFLRRCIFLLLMVRLKAIDVCEIAVFCDCSLNG